MSNGRLEQLGTPREVYRHPASAFVARFVGSMNEVPGTVGDPGTRAHRSAGRAHPAADGRSAGEDVLLLVRPEDLALRAEGDGLPGTVTATSFEGANTVVSVRLDGLDVLVAVHTSGATAAAVGAGHRTGVAIDGARAVAETPT